MTRRMHAGHRRRHSVALLCALALALFVTAFRSDAAAQSGTCFDPVPDPIAAGWTMEGNGSFQTGTPLGLRDTGNQAGDFISFFCPTLAPLANEVVLTPRLSIDAGFAPAPDGNTSVHVTIEDGLHRIRAVLLATGPATLRVAIDLGPSGQGPYTQGFAINSLNAEFTLKRLTNGDAFLSVPGGGSEEVVASSLPPSVRSGLEFGTKGDVPAANVSRWDTLGLPAVPACQNTPGAMLAPINADGSSNFKLGRTIPAKIRVLDCDGNPVDTLAPQVALQKLGAGGGAVNEVASSSAADSGTTMRSTGDGYYHFNLSTKQSQFNAGQDLTEGRYRLTLSEPSLPSPVVTEFDLRR